jgi:hypothetical protein
MGIKKGGKSHEIAAKQIYPFQVEKADELAGECFRMKYKGC